MSVDIRGLFDRYRVHWRDRGPNVSHNNIVISCPFCNRTSNPDHGEHLSISTIGEYFCYRNPAHKGRYLPKLFFALKIPKHEFQELVFKELKEEYVAPVIDLRDMMSFEPAERSDEIVSYLKGRYFSLPVDVCQRFHLLYAKEGVWAGRVIIPLTIGWTGRSLRSFIEPRYLANTTEDGFFAYSQGSKSCILLEGAVDGMRVVTVSRQFDVIAKCGGRISPAIINYLREKRYITVYSMPDSDVSFIQYYKDLALLKSYLPMSVVKPSTLSGSKDFGGLDESATRSYLMRLQ